MHVLHVSLTYKPAEIGGPTHSVAALAEGLVHRGHRVTVFATDAGLPKDHQVPLDRPLLVDGVEVWYFRRNVPFWTHLPAHQHVTSSGGYLPTPALVPAMRSVIPSLDVVHTHAPYVRAANIAARMAIAAGKLLFYSPRGSYHPEMLRKGWFKKKMYISLIEKPVMQRAAGLLGLTEREIESIRALGVSSPCHLIPNGVDVEQFRRTPRPRALSRFRLSRDQTVVLFLGRMREDKGAELLFDAFVKVAAARRNAVLVMAGPDEQQLTPRLRARASGLEDRILFPGVVGGDEKLDLLARADLFVLPSRSEGQSMAMLEALASGTPVLISARCDFDIAAASGAGWICELDVERLAADLSRLLADPSLLSKAGYRAFELARDKLSWKPLLARLEEAYSSGLSPAWGKTARVDMSSAIPRQSKLDRLMARRLDADGMR